MRILIQAKNFVLTDALEEYINKKNAFLEKFDKHILSISINLKKNAKKLAKFTYEVIIQTTNDTIRVVEEGNDIYVLIDLVHTRLHKAVETSKEKDTDHTHVDIDLEEMIVLDEEDITQSYTPIISKRKLYSDNRPLHPEEAIEQMEALGHQSFLFKNIVTNKYTMLTKEKDVYITMEPENA